MKPLTPASIQSLPGLDDITRVVLPNGITVLTRPNYNSPSVVLTGYISAGSLFDSDEKLGTAHFTAAALMRGTARRSFQEIYDALESAGASLGFGGGTRSVGFNGRALVEDLPLLLELVKEASQQPVFPPEQVERLRAQILTGLAIRAQDTAEMASLTFEGIVFAGHPYRRPDDGYPETIQAITRQDLVNYHQRHFGPQHMVIIVVGAIHPEKAIEMVSLALGDWQNPDQQELPDLPPLTPLKQAIRQHIPLAGKSQTDLVMGAVGPSRLSPDYLSASLGNNVLGQFGLSGRIGDVVREQSGLAYYAYTSLNAGIGPGTWEVSAGINPENVEKTIELVQAEIRRFVQEPVSAEELSDSQANYIGRLPLSLESNNGMASALLNLERYHLGLDYYRQYSVMIQSITTGQILDSARQYLDPDCLAIVTSGPQE